MEQRRLPPSLALPPSLPLPALRPYLPRWSRRPWTMPADFPYVWAGCTFGRPPDRPIDPSFRGRYRPSHKNTPVRPVLARPPCQHHILDCAQTLPTLRSCPKPPGFKRQSSQTPVSARDGAAKMKVAKNTPVRPVLAGPPCQHHTLDCAQTLPTLRSCPTSTESKV